MSDRSARRSSPDAPSRPRPGSWPKRSPGGLARAAAAGFASVVVACEPTGHRWRVLDQIAADAGLRLVCVQPLLVGRAREAEDFTRNKNDDSDAVIIARLVTELRCYLPERAEPAWARLRHLGARRIELVLAAGAAGARVRDLLECAWPAVWGAAVEPLESASWRAALTVVLDRVADTGDLSMIRRSGWSRFATAVRRELPRQGTPRWHSPIVRASSPPLPTPPRPGSESSSSAPAHSSGSASPSTTWPMPAPSSPSLRPGCAPPWTTWA